MKLGQTADTPARWTAFCKQYKAEMAAPAAKHDLALLAALSTPPISRWDATANRSPAVIAVC